MMLIDYLDRGARIAPDAPCMVRADGTVVHTHAEFEALTHRIAAALLADGLRAGERVAVFSPNDADAFACVVGVIRAGGVWTAANAASREAELAGFLGIAGCGRLIYHGSIADRASTLLDLTPSIKTAVSIGPGRPGDPVLADWMAPTGTRAPDQSFDPDRPMMMLPTGGTTGTPKAVPVSNRQMLMLCWAFGGHFAEPEPPRYICATPMTHAAGGCALPVIAEGGSVIIHQGVDPAEILTSIERNRASRMFLPPTAVYALLGHPGVRDHDYSSLRNFLVSAAPIAPERLAEAVEVFGPVMCQAYGQAESPMICTVFTAPEIAAAATDPTLRGRLAACGRPSYIARVEIMADDGTLLGPEQAGEIVIRSDLVFAGYWDNPAGTEETRRPGGWHGTGDIGKRDADGFVYILDRKKGMIISGGFNVYPSEVEAVLHTFPEVNDCAVIGVPDAKWGEAVTAVMEPKAGAEIDTERVIAVCKQRLGSVKAPKSVLVRGLPRSPVGKVLKRALRDEYWSGADRQV